MQQYGNNSSIIKFLVSSRLKIFRHLILFAFIFSISVNFIWSQSQQADNMTGLYKYGIILLFTFLFLSVCYFNIYILTPKLLLENKWGIYFSALSGLVIIMIILILFFLIFLIDNNQTQQDILYGTIHYISGGINLLSSILCFFLLFAGTSSFVVFKHWIIDMQQSEELKTTTLQMELKLLENQINPHFLFNVLNNANIKIGKDPEIAMHIIGKLQKMLGYLMNKGISSKISLKEEVAFIIDYLELEKTRRDHFTYTVSTYGDIDNIHIPPFLFITFIENAVKHNHDSRSASFVNVSLNAIGNTLLFICVNSVPQHTVRKKDVGGIGLVNIKRRLDLLYNGNHSLEQTKTDVNYTVKLKLKL